MPTSTGVTRRLDGVPAAALAALTLTPGAPRSLQDYLPVVALTLTDGVGVDRKVLVCVRDPRTNVTHPDVLSSPTKRAEGIDTLDDLLVDGLVWNGAVPAWLSQVCDRILQEKLAVPAFVAAAAGIRHVAAWQGESIIGTGPEGIVTESLTMINVHLEVTGMASMFADQTDSYREIHWISDADHLAATSMRNAAAIGVEFRGKVPIVYGLCTNSTAAMLASTAATVPDGARSGPAVTPHQVLGR